MLEILGTARVLSVQDTVAPHWVGTARRAYSSIGALTLHGLASERVVSADGYAGVVTHFVDVGRRNFSVADVRGGPASRAKGAYAGAIGLGSTITHQAAGRSRVLLQGATASTEGRLGSGARVRAVGSGASRWDDDVVRAMFDRSLAEQLEQTWVTADPLGPRVDTLLFATGMVLGADDDALWMELNGGEGAAVVARGAIAGGADNLRVLAQAPGLVVRVLGRVDRLRRRTLQMLALSAAPEHEDALDLPAEWGGTCNLGLDVLPRSAIRDLRSEVVRFEPEPEPLLGVRRRIQAMLLGGRGTVSPALLPQIEREARQLRERMCPTGADALHHLATQALDTGRALDGRRLEANADALADAWLTAALWERTASEALVRASWRPA